jgi:cellulose synthase/poly-beta-1,6-N-acetylglucosamine synthase-like glycosyltransferase
MRSITTSYADGVSVVVPVRNGAPWLARVLDALLDEDPGVHYEIIAIDDGSTDGSSAILTRFNRDPRVRVIDGPGRGATAALNLGLAHAQCASIAQVDQDVVVGRGWLDALRRSLDDPKVAAAQGYYVTDPAAPLSARVMGLDLEQRYARIEDGRTDHVCTGNTLYRTEALAAIGGFDESFGYGYDNDVSYRLREAGYELRLCREAKSQHHWREGVWPYLVQQYGFGYGRLDVVWRHRRRVMGDRVSPAAMMLHPVLLGGAIAVAAVSAIAGRGRSGLTVLGVTVAFLMLERAIAGIRASRRYHDRAGLAFPVFHLGRDIAWVAAILAWMVRRMFRMPPQPGDSMRPRPAGPVVSG